MIKRCWWKSIYFKLEFFFCNIKTYILLQPSSPILPTYEHSLLYRTGFCRIHQQQTVHQFYPVPPHPIQKYHIISQSTFTHVYLEEFDVGDYRYTRCTALQEHIFKRIWPHVEYIITLGEKSICYTGVDIVVFQQLYIL